MSHKQYTDQLQKIDTFLEMLLRVYPEFNSETLCLQEVSSTPTLKIKIIHTPKDYSPEYPSIYKLLKRVSKLINDFIEKSYYPIEEVSFLFITHKDGTPSLNLDVHHKDGEEAWALNEGIDLDAKGYMIQKT